VDVDRDLRGAAGQARLQHGVHELARADPADRHAAVDAAEVEPQAVPAVALHGVGPAPVGAHDERVADAGLQGRAHLEGQVLARVAADELAVDEDLGLVVDRLEADRVETVGRHLDLRAIPADHAAERGDAAAAADPRGIGDERDPDEIAAERALGVALGEADVVAVGFEAPQPVELRAVAGPGVDERRGAVRRQHDRARRRVGCRRRDGHEHRDHDHKRAQAADCRSNQPPAHSILFIVSSGFMCRGSAHGNRCRRGNRPPRCNAAAGRM
jgi:hypothetical protein